jgi:hypothetical protein
VSWPHLVGVLPPLAVGRLERPADVALQAAVAAGGGAAVACQVLAGFGGVGKTQLAASLAHRWWREQQVDLLIWVTATSRTAVLTRYVQAAADVTGVEDADPGDGALRLLAWLASTRWRWLVVLDDLTDPADLQGLWPPVTATGRTVVTTRRRDTALLDGRSLIDVGLFTPVEAVDYLRGKLGDQPHRLAEAAELAGDLGRLPLALAQAAAYIADQDLTCASYRRRLTRRRLHTLRPAALPDDQHTAVAGTWGLSIDLTDAATEGVAGILLQLAALLDPHGIPPRIFATTAVTGYCTTRTGQPATDEDTHDAVRALHRLSLITVTDLADTDAGAVRVHALLQRVVRENTPAELEHDLARAAADALVETWPAIERDTELGQALRANTAALHQHGGSRLWIPAGHPVLFRAGNSLGEAGRLAAAASYWHDLYELAVSHLAPDHPDTFTIRNNLAYWLGRAGNPFGAAASYAQLLPDLERVLGADHPDTLASRGNLARCRGDAGDPAGAAAAYTDLLADFMRVLGPDHPDTLTTRHNLAGWCGQSGDPDSAAAALADLLDDRLRVLGPDHPDTLATRSALAQWRGWSGDAAGAAAAYNELFPDAERVLGPDHPDTLTMQGNRAAWWGQSGDAAAAAAALAELLDRQIRILGPDHPDTLGTRGSLANYRGKAGDPVGAADALGDLFADQLELLGPDHFDTLATRNNRAYWLWQLENVAGAGAAFADLLDDVTRVLGPDHPMTRATRDNLAHLRRLET